MRILDSIKEEIKKRIENDPAHDFDHIMRVYKNAQKICKKEKVNEKFVLCAALLHDLISHPKSDKRSKMSSIESAKKSQSILQQYGFSTEEISLISDAIRDHSFSQNKIPTTIEGKILQDADRLDALGAIGIARVFATSGLLKRQFYNMDDPFCKKRIPDDKIWAVDHFFKKLLKLESMMNTKSGKEEAKKRTKILKEFLKQLKHEI
ncbi:HD domain-containing protein [Nitrosopumilus ureiphilus]|uniref:Phosphohydrolase n=1 Tax=Nitrosopumilus ureiphilus TaxID=1470067 RepID=A0A7D5R2H3_9ARCH|nr:HD domain-containing protein [Nitrosopumilus ureiphilus]QLH06280.1 phosphohydrolase [Nitrosopumilus ureiphilus]